MRDCSSDRSQQKYWHWFTEITKAWDFLLMCIFSFFIVTLSSQKFPSTQDACQMLRSLKFCEHQDAIVIPVLQRYVKANRNKMKMRKLKIGGGARQRF
jgi:hypothetical protein